jgi:hypothetical protein
VLTGLAGAKTELHAAEEELATLVETMQIRPPRVHVVLGDCRPARDESRDHWNGGTAIASIVTPSPSTLGLADTSTNA